jgi:hypothetical protein
VISAWLGWRVESGHEFAGGGAVFVAFVELLSKVEVVLFELADSLVECINVGGGAKPPLAPGVCAERLGEPLLESADAGIEPGGSFVGGEQVGL